MPDWPKTDLLSELVADAKMQAMADYVKRGRPHAGKTTGELLTEWTLQFKVWFVSRNSIDHTSMRDLGAELILRDVEVPTETVEAEMTLARSEISADRIADITIDNFLQRRSKLPN